MSSEPRVTNNSDARYAPPKSAVADVERSNAPAKPAQVVLAIKCLWVGLGLGALLMAWSFFGRSAPEMETMDAAARTTVITISVAFTSLILLLSLWVNLAVAKGRNWARILYFVFNLFWLITLPYVLYSLIAGQMSAAEALTNLLDFVLSLYTCYLLLTAPAKEWFRMMQERH